MFEDNLSSDELISSDEEDSSLKKKANKNNNDFHFSSEEEISIIENERTNSCFVKNIFDEFGQQINKAMQIKKMKFENSFEGNYL